VGSVEHIVSEAQHVSPEQMLPFPDAHSSMLTAAFADEGLKLDPTRITSAASPLMVSNFIGYLLVANRGFWEVVAEHGFADSRVTGAHLCVCATGVARALRAASRDAVVDGISSGWGS
jgi:hypothetical protein